MGSRVRVVLAVVASVLVASAGIAPVAVASAASAVPAVTAAASAGSPVGAFDGLSVTFTKPDHMSGWAADPSTPGQPIEVRVYLDGKLYGSTRTGRDRADVGRAVPWAGSATGWRLAMDPTGAGLRPPGKKQLCAYAINVGPGARTLLGCHSALPGTPNPANPVGSVDRTVASPGLVRLTGWAADPDGKPTTRLEVFIDGTESLTTVAALPRPDVHAARGLSATSGFDITLPMLPGRHGYLIIAENTGLGDWNPIIGEGWTTTPGVQPPGPHDARGQIEGVGFHEIGLDDRDWKAWGWAYDPDSSAPITILFRAEAYSVTDRPDTGLVTRRLLTGVARLDIQEDVDPAAGPNSGFDGHLLTTGLGTIRYVCAYAENVGAGASRFLGCSTDEENLGTPD